MAIPDAYSVNKGGTLNGSGPIVPAYCLATFRRGTVHPYVAGLTGCHSFLG